MIPRGSAREGEAVRALSPAGKRALLERLLREREAGASLALRPDPGGRYEPFALTDVQQAYLLGRSGYGELSGVGVHGYVEIDCLDLDVTRLEEAWRRLIERHDMLRAVILPDGRQCVRPFEEAPRFDIPCDDWRGVEPREIDIRTAQIREEMSHEVRPADSGYLFDFRSARIDDRTTRLFLSVDLLNLDLGSLVILVREWRLLYEQPEARLPPLPIGYRDYARALEDEGKSRQGLSALEFWRARLSTLPPKPELAHRIAANALRKPRFVRRMLRTSRQKFAQFENRARGHGLTPSSALLAAYAEVLALYGRDTALTINVTLFNRRPFHPAVHDLVGDFTSMMPVDFDAEIGGFVLRAKAMQVRLWEGMEKSAVSGVRIRREFRRQRGLRGEADLSVVFTSALGIAPQGDGLASFGHVRFAVSQTPQVELDYQVVPEPDGSVLHNWDAVEELFPEGLIDRMQASFARLVDLLALDGEAWKRETFDICDPIDLQPRVEANRTAAVVVPTRLEEAFERQTSHRPDRTALVDLVSSMSYGALLGAAGSLAKRLREAGVARGDRVGILAREKREQLIGVLGTLKAGGAYVPLDANAPPARRAALLAAVGARAVCTDGSCDPAEPDEARSWISIRTAMDDASHDAGEVDAEDLAYVIFTSGSTGRPKGVAVRHRAAWNTIRDLNERFEIGAADRVLAVSSLAFDLSVYDIFGLLGSGGAVVAPAFDRASDPAHWLELIENCGVTVWNSVPALMTLLVDELERRGVKEMGGSLRLVLLSGDWIPIGLPDRIRRLWPKTDIYSLGGATEAGIWSTIFKIDAIDQTWPSIPYGKPLTNQHFRIVDSRGLDRPTHVSGELWIGGESLAQGYWDDPDRTEAAFVFDARAGQRYYRTGDACRYRPDGHVEILGRLDRQVKIRGHRIEPGEVESVLRQDARVRDVVVDVRGQAPDQQRLVAWVIVDDAAMTAELVSDLKSRAAAGLPAYMVPSAVHAVAKFPLTANGKIDRQALAEPQRSEEPVRKLPLVGVEVEIAGLATEVLQIGELGPLDNFFDQGCTSMQLVQIQGEVRRRFHVDIPIAIFLEHASVRGIAALVRGGEAAPDSADIGAARGRIRRETRMRRTRPRGQDTHG